MLVCANETACKLGLGEAGRVGEGQELFKSPTVHSFLIPARRRTFRSFKWQMKLLGLSPDYCTNRGVQSAAPSILIFMNGYHRNNLYSFTPIKIQDVESCWWIKQTICCKFKKFQSECRWPSFVFWEITKEWCKIYGCRGGESSLGWNLINDACTIPTSRCHKVAGSLTCAAKFRLFFACSVSRTFCCSSGLTMKTSALISMEVFVPNDTIQLMRTCY